MSKLIEHLANYLKKEIINAVNSSPKDSLRVIFSAPPQDQIEALFEYLTGNDRCMFLDTEHERIQVPVYLVDPNAQDPNENSMVARCTPSFLVTIRNYDEYRIWVALQEVGAPTNASLVTAVKPLGITKELSLDSWLETPVISYLISEVRSAIGIDQDESNSMLRYALEEAWNADLRNKDKRTVWQLIEKLLAVSLQDGSPRDVMTATLGFPYLSSGETSKDQHLKLVGRISAFFVTNGLRQGFRELENKAKVNDHSELLPHIASMSKHIENQNIIDAGEFSRHSLKAYSPVQPSSLSIPNWWYGLGYHQWLFLLDSGVDEEEAPHTDRLKVKLSNPLVVVPKGLMPLVKDRVELQISVEAEDSVVEVIIERSNASQKLTKIHTEEVQAGEPIHFSDENIPNHKAYIRYKVSVEGHEPVFVKVVVLDYYTLGVIAFSQGAIKASAFKLNNKARDQQNKKVIRYESSLQLPGIGSHYLNIFTSKDTKVSDVILGYEIDVEHTEAISYSINRIDENHFSCLIDVDEECHYEVFAHSPDIGGEIAYRVYITAEESQQTGATSEFDRLVMMHRASASGKNSSPRVDPLNCRAMELETWILETDNSYKPLIMGEDYTENWKRPNWESLPCLSSRNLLVDPRPPEDDFIAPITFLESRKKLLNILAGQRDELTPSASTLPLYKYMKDETYVVLLSEFLNSYFDWLKADYNHAIWCDVITVHSERSKALESTPYAIMLSPFHPVRLAWQCCAQDLLQKALDKHSKCPAASVMNPTNFPDCLILPCRTATGTLENKPFVAMANSSDYWGVLLSTEPNSLSSLGKGKSIFGDSLGISVDGFASGFSAQQVVRSFDEVSRLMAAKSTLRIGLSSDTGGSSSCNEGIDAWCSSNLGEEEDYWKDAGQKSVVIDDRRESSLHPEQAILASLTARTDAAVRWFVGGDGDKDKETNDLSIIAHLSTISPSFEVQEMRSAVDMSGLTRWRIRKQLPNQNVAFIAESRVGNFYINNEDDSPKGTLRERLLSCIDELERQCRNSFDSYIFAPDMTELSEVVGRSSYTALSSSNVDAACFFGTTDKAYLWDYELPSYARRAGENSGYYLLAKETDGMIHAVRSALNLLRDRGELSDDDISLLLKEISRRGMPTLKRLTTGGSMSFGEIGMLVALRVLQAEFEQEPNVSGLLPVKSNGRGMTLNIVISADPFQKHFDDLRAAIGFHKGERPDLLVMSILFDAGSPVQMQVTPVEVKARNSAMSDKEMMDALGQASIFSDLLHKIQEEAEKVELWGIAWRNLIATMLDYGFRVYGQLSQFMNAKEWAEQHSSVLRSIACNEMKIDIDTMGRLIVIDNSDGDSQRDVDSDGFDETIVLSHAQAFSILARTDSDFTERMNIKVGDWRFKPSVESNTNDISELPTSEPNSPENEIIPKPEANEVKATGIKEDGEELATQGIHFSVGETINQFREEQLTFFPSNTALTQLNVGIVGDLGTGKTQLIQALVKQLASGAKKNRGKQPNILIFDYKKDYSKAGFVEKTGARVVSPYNIPLNLFDVRDSPVKSRAQRSRTKFFIDILDKIYSGIGPVQRQKIKAAVKAAYKIKNDEGNDEAPTLNDVFDAYKIEVEDKPDTPYTIMDDLVDDEYFVDDNSDVIPFSEFLEGVVVVDLSEIGQDDRAKNMLVVIFLNLFYEHMLRIEKKDFVGEDPKLRFVDSMLLVDEADNIMQYEFDVLKKILLQGREFGVGVLLASQYLSHFKTSHENYLEPLLSWFVHKVPNVTVKELEGIGLTNVNQDTVEKIKSLECHQCLFKTLDVDGKFMRGTPFFELVRNNES